MSTRRTSPVEDSSIQGRSRREHKAPAAYDPSEEAARAQWGGKDVAPPGPSRRRASPAPRAEAPVPAAKLAPAAKKRAPSPKPAGGEVQRAASPTWEKDLVRSAEHHSFANCRAAAAFATYQVAAVATGWPQLWQAPRLAN